MRVPSLGVPSGCKVINVANGVETPCRIFYTNDLQCKTEQVAWRARAGEQSRLELSRERSASACAFPAMGAGEPLMVAD